MKSRKRAKPSIGKTYDFRNLKIEQSSEIKIKMSEEQNKYWTNIAGTVKYINNTSDMMDMCGKDDTAHAHLPIHKNSYLDLHRRFQNQLSQYTKRRDLRDRLRKKLEARRQIIPEN